MTERVVAKHNLEDPEAANHDLQYWLSRSHEERIEAVDTLRELFYGSTPRLQRISRVIEQAPC